MPVAQSHPFGTEVNDMCLNPITQLDTVAQSHNPNERLCEKRREQTERRAPLGATGNQGPPRGIRQVEHPRSTPPSNGSGCKADCASWLG